MLSAARLNLALRLRGSEDATLSSLAGASPCGLESLEDSLPASRSRHFLTSFMIAEKLSPLV